MAQAQPASRASQPAPRRVVPGNIDLFNRPKVRNPDGSVSTVRTIGVEDDGYEVNIPTVVGKRVVSDEDAYQHYRRTGQHLGKYPVSLNGRKVAASMARKLHSDYAAGMYDRRPGGKR